MGSRPQPTEPLTPNGGDWANLLLSRLANPGLVLSINSVTVPVDHFLTASSEFEERSIGPSMLDTLVEMNVQIASA